MKVLRDSLLILTFLTAGFCVSDPAFAQTKVLVTPDAIAINGVRGAQVPSTRVLSVRATAPVSNLRVYAFDLFNSERDRVFPKALITVPSSITQVTVDTPEDLSVTFNWQNAPSGEFQGNLLVTQQGNEVLVPVTVRVKDSWPWPLVLLVLGVILGTTVSSYSRWGKTTDEITVGVERLRTQTERDQQLPASFQARISAYLADARVARDDKQLDAAQQAIASAQEVWKRWFRQREDWIAALDAGHQLRSQFDQLSPHEAQTRYLPALQRILDDTLTRVVDRDTPKALGDQVNLLSRQLAIYRKVSLQLSTLQKAIAEFQIPYANTQIREALQALKQGAESLERQLTTLLPTEQAEQSELLDVEKEIDRLADELAALQAKADEELRHDDLLTDDLESIRRGRPKSAATEPPTIAPTEPSVGPLYETPEIAADENPILKAIAALVPDPNLRLQLFSLATWLITIAFLSAIGFNQLYLNRPTFGADRPRDYFSLLAWGFGAEATRSVVTNALRRSDGGA